MLKARYDPGYALKVTGPSGYEIVLFDRGAGWFKIERFDTNGRIVVDTNIMQDSQFADWLGLFRRLMPNETILRERAVWRRNMTMELPAFRPQRLRPVRRYVLPNDESGS